MARVTRTKDARADLKEIGRYIAEKSQSLETAFRFLDRIQEKCELYATQPEMGTARPDLGTDVRVFPVDDYIVIYRPKKAGIEILMVTHGSRDVPPILKRRL
jgi:toxin ParE1/3/4